MDENSSLGSIYIGSMTTVIETLTELAHSQVDPDDYSLNTLKENHTVRFQAVLDLVNVANQIRNHERLDYIVNDKELAKAYFAAGRSVKE